MKQIRDLIIGPKEPDLKNVGWVSFDKNTQKYELKFYINGRWLPIVSNIDTIEPEKIEKVKELIEWINNNGTDFNNSKVNSIIWNNINAPTSNMNDFVIAGVYDIKGERTRIYDNLPILNTGGGHTFHARLTVLDSSISGSGEDDNKCITQVLSFSNRLGQGEIYIRTGKGSSFGSLSWEKWSTLQRNVNVGQVFSLDEFVDNGIYSGVWTDGSSFAQTFVMVVINDYAVAEDNKTIVQYKYAYDTIKGNGKPTYNTRSLHDGVWSDWEDTHDDELKGLEKELLSRIQGKSENSDATTDPFKLLTLPNGYNFSKLDDLIAILDNMHANTAAEGKKYMGAFRAILNHGVVTIYNTPLSVGDDVWMQTITGCFRPDDDGKLTIGYNNYGMFYRKLENSEWSSWKIANENIIKEWINISNGVVDEKVNNARAELEKRIQGTSDKSSAWGDAFKKIKDFNTLQSFDTYLQDWHGEDAADTKQFVGNFRTNVAGIPIEIFSTVVGYGDKNINGDTSVWVQEIKGAIDIDKGAVNHLGTTDKGFIDTKFISKDEREWYSRTYKQGLRFVSRTNNSGIHTLRRIYDGSLGGWGEWIDIDNPYIASPLYGKNVLILGGSFAHNMKAYMGNDNTGFGFDIEGRQYSLQNYIAKQLGLKRFDNFAVSGNGACISNSDFSCNIYQQLVDALECAAEHEYKYDAIIFQGGINDYQAESPSPLGSLTDLAGDNTFYASYKKIINLARTHEQSKDAKLFMTTPFKAFHKTECWKSTEQTINKAGHRYYDYLQAIRDIAQYASIPLLDIWSIQQVDSNNYGIYYRYQAGDNTHPNGQGYLQVAPAFIEFLAWGKGDVNVDIESYIKPIDDKITAEIQRAKDAEKANADAINAEKERAKQAEQANRQLISDLVGESPETLDTIHEISSWILNDETGAAAMAKEINENKNAVTGLKEGVDKSFSLITKNINNESVDLDFGNDNNPFLQTISILNANELGAGVMSAKDYNYLHSLNSTKELSIVFTGNNEIIRLSQIKYPFIPKGVRIEIISDTITILRGYTEEFSKEFTIKDGYVTEDNIAILQNFETIGKVTIKYTGAIKEFEKELTARIQGKSRYNNPLDDIVYLGNFVSYHDLIRKLETLHSDDPGEAWDYCGLFTATIQTSSRVFIMNSCTSFEDGVWQQSIIGNVQVVETQDELGFYSHGMNIVHRYRKNGSWSEWRNINEGIVTMTVTPDENTIELETETDHGGIDYYYIPSATTTTAGVMSAEDKKYTLSNIDKTVTLVSSSAYQSLNLGYIIPKGASVHIEGDFKTISCRTNPSDTEFQTISSDGIADRDITHIKMQGVGTATMTIKGVIIQKIDDINDLQTSLQTLKIKECYILESNLVPYPARRSGAQTVSGEDFKGYEIDLEEAYINGYRYIKVRTSTRIVSNADTAVLPAIVLDKTGTVESLIETEPDKVKTTTWYILPITENSKTLRATYASGKYYPDTKLVPYKYELLTELPPQVVDYSNDIENLNTEITNLKKAEGLDIYLIPENYPARKDGSNGSSGAYKGYEVSIEDAFSKGFRFIKVRAASYIQVSSDTSIVPCLIYDKNGNVESVITEFESFSTAWYILPITENSSKVKCSYATAPFVSGNNVYPNIVFEPYKYELLTDYDDNDNDIEERLSSVEEELESIEKNVEIFLPPEIYILKGRMTQLFFRGFIKAVNPYIYDIKVQCAVGKTYKRYYEIEHNTSGDFPFKIEVRDDNKRVLGVAETTIKIIESTSISSKNILCCGASATETGHWAGELKRLLTTGSEKYNGLNLPMTFVGRKVGSSDKSVQLEATGGWTWSTFISAGVPAVRFYVTGMTGNIGIGTKLTLNDAEKGTLHYSVLEVNLTEGVGNIRCGEDYPNPVVVPSSTSGTLIGDSISITYNNAVEERFVPFYNAETGEVDFRTYADNYCNGDIDIIITHMGVNSVLAENSPTPTASIKAFLDGYFRDFPNGKILMSAIPFPDYGTNIYTNTYKVNNTNRYGSLCSFFDYNKNLYEISQLDEYKGKVIYCPSNVFFDTDYGYPKKDKDVNNRIASIKESIDTNGVHPIKEGSYLISDSILPTIITL